MAATKPASKSPASSRQKSAQSAQDPCDAQTGQKSQDVLSVESVAVSDGSENAAVANIIPGYPNLKPWPKGVSGNPSGRNQWSDGRKRVATTALDLSEKAMRVLAKQLDSKDEGIAQRAAMEVLSRAVGKPIQPNADVDADGNDRPPPPPMTILPVMPVRVRE